MRTLTPMAEKGAFVCQPVSSASGRRILREGFTGLLCEAASSAAGNIGDTANGGLVLTDGVKRLVARKNFLFGAKFYHIKHPPN